MAQFGRFDDLRFARLGIAPWKLALAIAALIALALAAIVVATGVFLVAVPVIVVAGLAARLFAKKPAVRPERPRGTGPLIEGEYRVVGTRPMPQSPWGGSAR